MTTVELTSDMHL